MTDNTQNLPPEIEKLFRTFRPFDVVRAACDIFYGTGESVSKGERGVVLRMGDVPVAYVVWDAQRSKKIAPRISVKPRLTRVGPFPTIVSELERVES